MQSYNQHTLSANIYNSSNTGDENGRRNQDTESFWYTVWYDKVSTTSNNMVSVEDIYNCGDEELIYHINANNRDLTSSRTTNIYSIDLSYMECDSSNITVTHR